MITSKRKDHLTNIFQRNARRLEYITSSSASNKAAILKALVKGQGKLNSLIPVIPIGYVESEPGYVVWPALGICVARDEMETMTGIVKEHYPNCIVSTKFINHAAYLEQSKILEDEC